jgi:hypothetical protein
MGDLRPDNGGPWPPEEGGGHSKGLPDFPPEWGTIVIPDDASELDDEAEQVRRELSQETRRDQLGRLFGVPFPYNSGAEAPSGLGVPLVIMAVAILTTLISLFVVTWDRRPDQPLPVTAATGGGVSAEQPGPDTPAADLSFVDATGLRIRLGDLLPAVILLVDGCACTDLVTGAAASAPAGVRVVAVANTAPNLAGAPGNVKALADPTAVLRSRFAPGTESAPDAASALLINRAGEVERVPRAKTVDDLVPHMARLVG